MTTVDYSTLNVKSLIKLAGEKLGLTQAAAKKLKKEGLLAALGQAELAAHGDVLALEHAEAAESGDANANVRLVLKGEVIAEVGSGGRLFTVKRNAEGLVWCDCPEWVASTARPRMCGHIEQLLGMTDPMDGTPVLTVAYTLPAEAITAAANAPESLEERRAREIADGTIRTLKEFEDVEVKPEPKPRAPREPKVQLTNMTPAFKALRKAKIWAVQAVPESVFDEQLAWVQTMDAKKAVGYVSGLKSGRIVAVCFTERTDVASFMETVKRAFLDNGFEKEFTSLTWETR